MRTTTTNARPSWLGIYPATPDIYSDTPQTQDSNLDWSVAAAATQRSATATGRPSQTANQNARHGIAR